MNSDRTTEFILTSADLPWSASFEARWNSLLDQSSNTLTLFQSPEWTRSLLIRNKNIHILTYTDGRGEINGIVPVSVESHKIRFDIKARALLNVATQTVHVLGSLPLLPEEESAYDALFQQIGDSFPTASSIYFDSLPLDSFLWKYLQSSATRSRQFILHVPEGTRSHFGLALAGSFDEYLAGFKKKRRAEFMRRLKVFATQCGDTPHLTRIDSAEQVHDFLAQAAAISKNSWQSSAMGNRVDTGKENCLRLSSLANDGFLRAYLLFCKGVPCAFRLGYQYGDRYLSAEIGYDLAFHELSPGKVLTLKMIEDLTKWNPPRHVDFGIGYAQWKKDLCNTQTEDASVFLFRKTLQNRILTASQSGFYFLIDQVKRLLAYRKKESSPTE